MKKIIIIAILCLMSQRSYAAAAYFKDITNFTKIVDMYKRTDATRQPKFISFKKGEALLNQVNNYYNEDITYTNEETGKDYWQSPKETIKLRRGDCEDYAVVKWQALLDNGIPEADMYFMEGKHRLLNTMHTILLVMIDNKPYYLDNTTSDLRTFSLEPDAYFTVNRFGFTVYNFKEEQE